MSAANIPQLDEAYIARARAQQRARARWRQKPRQEGVAPPPLQTGTVEEDHKCAQDSAYFIHNHVQIEQPQAQNTEPTMVPFHLWPAQVGVLTKLALKRLVIILKARQLGLSWLVCAYALWLCMYRAGQTVLVFSKTDVEAEEMIRRITVMYNTLAEWVRRRHPLAAPPSTHKLVFRNNSRIRALTSTTSGGRTFTASLVIMDEAAFMARADELYTALKPTIDGGGQLIIISTFNKIDDWFDKMWAKAISKLNRFIAIFLPWTARPDRTQEWYNQVASEAVSHAHHLREYPATPEESRQTLESERFLPSMTFWTACKGDLPAYKSTIVLGADGAYASGGDSFGLVGVGRHPKERDAVVVRLVRKWQAKKGEPALNFEEIQKQIIEICRTWRVLHIAYDPTQLHHMFGEGSKIRTAGINCEEVNQGAEIQEADKSLYDRIMQQTILHDGDPDLHEHLDNADRHIDAKGRLRIIKRSETKKIDLAKACSMAAYRAKDLYLQGGSSVAMGKAKSNWLGGQK